MRQAIISNVIGLFFLFYMTVALASETVVFGNEQVRVDNHVLHVEVAVTGQAKRQGLMFRSFMPKDEGMLFVYHPVIPVFFWMKNTLIPLDILYFDKMGRLFGESLNTPPCRADPCPLYSSKKPVAYVLELNAGVTKKLGIKIGTKLSLFHS
ncbi:MAG TPA: DUF192 domain-containing protein [Burkholderiales bacterium]|nr:DUF192 domain-containing protein [Burkholderiales bacterium]